MNRKHAAMVGIVAFTCGGAAFFNARSTALSHKETPPWLSGASDSTIAMEDRFNEEMAGLTTNLMSEQKSLGLALDDPCTPDEAVVERSESLIGTHEHLMRRVGEHVVGLRRRLSADNREYLMSLCAETVRGPVRRLEGGGGGRGMHNGAGGGMGNGQGYGRYGAGRGAGPGRGMRRGIRDRLANQLKLDERQISLLHQEDADFEAETTGLRDVYLSERARLLSMFEDPKSEDDQLLRQIEELIAAHSGIERRVVKHVLVLRPYLTVEQQKWLIGLCLQNQYNR